MIFQDPYGSLNPRRRVGSIIGDPFAIHGIDDGAARKRRVQELMELVGLNPEHYNRFPAEFSGGQRQRIGVARALALRPKLIVCDEPVSALDVSIQAQIINLLVDLQKEFGLTYVFISHDLSVVRHVSDRIAVMYLGKIVEIARRRGAVRARRGTRTPGRCCPRSRPPDPDSADSRERIVLAGDMPSPVDPPSGCRFHPAARRRSPTAWPTVPPLEPVARRPAGAPHRVPPPAARSARTSARPASADRRETACRDRRRPGEAARTPMTVQVGARSTNVARRADAAIEGRGPWLLAWRRLRRDRVAMVSLVVIVLIALLAIFAPVFVRPHRAPAERAVPRDRADRRRPSPAAELDLLVRHRRPRPGHPGPDRLRRPGLAGRRRGRDAADGRRRRRGRARGRLPRRHRRHRAGPAGRRRAVDPVPAGRDRPGVDHRAEPDRSRCW